MARMQTRKKAINLRTAAERAKLKPRTAPYSEVLGPGIALLLYVGAQRHTWKSRTPEGGDKVIAAASRVETEDIPPLPLDGGMTYEEARAAIYKVVATETLDPSEAAAQATTFGDVWERYMANAARQKTDRAMSLLRSYGKQIEPLFPLPVSTTSESALVKWRDDLIGSRGDRGKPRTAASVGKTVAALKAALNAARVKGPWQDLTKPKAPKFRHDKEERPVFTVDEARAFCAAASSVDTAFGAYAEGLMLTGCRPAELAQATVSDVRKNPATGKTELLIRYGKTRDKTGNRVVRLSERGQRFFEAQIAGRDGGEILFPPTLPAALATEWHDNRYRRFVAKAADEIGKPGATLYSLRHGYITTAIYQRVPLTSIAKQCGTSVAMIEKTYAHQMAHMEEAAFSAFDAAMDGADGNKVQPLRAVK